MMDELFAKLVSEIRTGGNRGAEGATSPSMDERRQIAKLDVLRNSIERRFRTPIARERWLQGPLASLGGRSPLEVLAEGDPDTVLKLLE